MKHLIWVIWILLFITSCKKNKNESSIAIVSTTAVSNVTSNSAQAGGTIKDDGGSAITKRGVCWAIHAGPTIGDSISSDLEMPTFTSLLTNLLPNTVYYARAYAINGTGTGYGEELSFTTGKGVPVISTTAISSIVPLSAASGGNVLSDGGSTVLAKGICYATTAHPTIANFKTVSSTSTNSFSDTLKPLASQTIYYVRAYATNSYGTAYGNEISFSSSSANTLTDIDGNVYSYIVIGNQSWMASNLKVTRYRNGDSVTNGSSGFSWSTSNKVGAYTFPNGDANNNNKYGKLYNLFAVNESRNIAPVGWHIPTDDEWKILEKNQGMSQADADLTGYRGTISPLLIEGGVSGLNLQKAGYAFTASTPSYFNIDLSGFYYSSTPVTSVSNYYRAVNFKTGDPAPVYRNYAAYGMSVRCVKD